MSSGDYKWFRIYDHDLLNDPKLRRVAVTTGEDLATIRGIFLALLCLANQSPCRDGYLMVTDDNPMVINEIYYYLGMDDRERLENIINHLADPKLRILELNDEDGWYIVNWAERQTKADTTGAERQARYRRRKKKEERAARGADPRSLDPAKDTRSDEQFPETPDPAHHSTSNGTIQALIESFTQETATWPPADAGQTSKHWEQPIAWWLKLADDDPDLVESWMIQAININRGGNYAYHRPSSIDTTVIRLATQDSFKKTWEQFEKLMGAYGSKKEPPGETDPTMMKIIKAAGGWQQLKGLHTSVAKERFASAHGKVMSRDQQRIKRAS